MGQVESLANEPVDPDAELHVGIIAGKEDAVAELEQRYRQPFISRAIRKGLSPEDAEDAYQEVFFSTIERASTLEGPLGLSLRQYASRAMGYRIAEHHRGRPADASLDEIAEKEQSRAGPDPRSAPADEQVRAAVRRCLDGLTESYRVILEALFIEQMAPDTVAETLGMPRNTVYKSKGRALIQIRPCLEQALHAS